MLHILLIILKIIGIIIAVILGLLILLLAVVLCTPVRYRLEGTLDKEWRKSQGRACVTWLLHLVRIDVAYEGQSLRWKIRIAWKTLGSEKEKEKVYEENQDDKHEKPHEEKHEEAGKAECEKTAEVSEETRPEKIREEACETAEREKKAEIHEEPSKLAEPEKLEEKDKEKKKSSEDEKEHQTDSEKTAGKKMDPDRKQIETDEAAEGSKEKAGIFSKIKCTIRSICDKIKHIISKVTSTAESVSDTKERIIKELEDPAHQKAFTKVKKELGKLLRRWKPKTLKGAVHFGFEDPYHTGQVLALLSMIYPFLGGNLSVDPDFEQRILEGKLKIAGKIAIIPLVCFLWNLIWCKAVRQTYHDIRNFDLSEK